jgi:hypothetical protein
MKKPIKRPNKILVTLKARLSNSVPPVYKGKFTETTPKNTNPPKKIIQVLLFLTYEFFPKFLI